MLRAPQCYVSPTFAIQRKYLLEGFAEDCMAEYHLDGWNTPDLINPSDINYFTRNAS